jgi:hypothetical protein
MKLQLVITFSGVFLGTELHPLMFILLFEYLSVGTYLTFNLLFFDYVLLTAFWCLLFMLQYDLSLS